jgi:histidinol phosphatase-like enzyme
MLGLVMQKQLQDNGKKLEDICYAIKPKYLGDPVKKMKGEMTQKFLTHTDRRCDVHEFIIYTERICDIHKGLTHYEKLCCS